MLDATVRLTNTLGLHARAAAQLVRLVAKSGCTVTLMRLDSGQTADAKDILSVLQMAAGCGVELQILAHGDGENDLMHKIEKLFADKFGEE